MWRLGVAGNDGPWLHGSSIDLDELVEHWTVLEDERTLVGAKRGATRLGFALLLKFYTRHGRFPAGGAELPGAAVEFVAGQVGVSPAEVGSYGGRAIIGAKSNA